ncbi:hypothetical protein QBC99_002451 [Beijerinckia sp. GAS462]|nr:hypothetical protein [Beijerinckia sp. GAS462]SEC43021.1 hypothetical protein SAMN05443249_2671 [Beijerinckia sp. 28-YEA-48]
MSEFIKVCDCGKGDYVRADDRFDCLPANAVLKIEEDSYGLFIRCPDGRGHHYISELLDITGTFYVGLFRQEH